MNNAHRIIFMNRFFYPDHSATSQILSDLAFDMATQGRTIHVITSRLRYDDTNILLVANEEIEGVIIHRVWTSRFGRGNLLGRAIDYFSFYITASWSLWSLVQRDDIVVTKTDPPLLSAITAFIIRVKRANLVNWLQDLYPEVAQAMGIGRSRLAYPVMKLLYFMRNRSLHSACFNVVLGYRMLEKLDGLNVPREKIKIIPNWSDSSLIHPVTREENPLRQEWELGQKFVVGYSGNFGRTHDFDTILEAIKILSAKENHIIFLFIGGGAQLGKLEKIAQKNNLTNIQFRPYQPRKNLSQSLSVSDIHLVSLQPEYEGFIVPSKFYGIAASGRTTAFIGSPQGEIAQVIEQNDCGFSVQPRESQKLANEILDLSHDMERCQAMGKRAHTLFKNKYDKKISIDKWENLFKSIQSDKGHQHK